MVWKRFMMFALMCGALALPARAQPEIEALIFQNAGVASSGFHACGELGYTRILTRTENNFLEVIRMQSWDLVIIEMPFDIITQKALVAQLLEDHVAAGGRLLVNFNNLDEWPRLQRLMGVSRTQELLVPLNVLKTTPRHASYSISVPVFPWITNPWTDSGDHLTPDGNGIVVGQFEDQSAAMVLSNDGRTVVNGFDWDSYQGGPSTRLARVQIEYMMACRADLDQSTGEKKLDIFDFLAFQDLFIRQDPLANMVFDPSFDIFDFLAFQSAFVNGCQ
jgi:hypothetical protein